MTKNTNDWRKYEKKYNCTRRIINGAPYEIALDGSYKDYNARKKAILGEE